MSRTYRGGGSLESRGIGIIPTIQHGCTCFVSCAYRLSLSIFSRNRHTIFTDEYRVPRWNTIVCACLGNTSDEVFVDRIGQLIDVVDDSVASVLLEFSRLGVSPSTAKAIQTALSGAIRIGPPIAYHKRAVS